MMIIVKRELNNYDSWKALVDDNEGVRKGKGSRGAVVYRSLHNPNEVYLIFEWDDQKSYLDYFDMPDVQQALARTGTTEIIEVGEVFHLTS
ncbi:MAG: antibiotic biosynthesis monooxygenase [Anaerolineae bacterium]|nr:antibiotic biosynthesis monooxygenase [Anaerolineae bacterium]